MVLYIMIVIVAGMQRSGSTFSFNVVREFLESRGGVSVFATNSLPGAASASIDARHSIIKTHDPDEQINERLRRREIPCICTVRKPEDAIASWMQVFGFSMHESLDTYKTWLAWHRSMHPFMLNVRYDELDNHPMMAIRRIGKYLIGNGRFGETTRIWWKLRKRSVFKQSRLIRRDAVSTTDIGFSHYDNRTLFHKNHVSSVESRLATELLPSNDVRLIRRELSEFIDVNGNYRW